MSFSIADFSKKLICPVCGGPMSISSMRKPSKNTVQIKMKCPTHKPERQIDISVRMYEQAAGLLKKHLLLCLVCGAPVEIKKIEARSKTSIIIIECLEHRKGERIVNNSLLGHFHSVEIPPAGLIAAPGEGICPSCGQPVSPVQQFCGYCGAKQGVASSTFVKEKVIEREVVYIRCPYCKAKTPESSSHCPNCGAAV